MSRSLTDFERRSLALARFQPPMTPMRDYPPDSVQGRWLAGLVPRHGKSLHVHIEALVLTQMVAAAKEEE